MKALAKIVSFYLLMPYFNCMLCIDCSIPNCIVCNVVTNKCEQCEEGYSIDESEGKCEGE